MRELSFERDIDYRTIVEACFRSETGESWKETCVICRDRDSDDDDGYRWFERFEDLESIPEYVDCVVLSRGRM